MERKYRGRVVKSFVAPDGTTRWATRVKCHSGCCEGFITKGTLAAVQRHLDKQMQSGGKGGHDA